MDEPELETAKLEELLLPETKEEKDAREKAIELIKKLKKADLLGETQYVRMMKENYRYVLVLMNDYKVHMMEFDGEECSDTHVTRLIKIGEINFEE